MIKVQSTRAWGEDGVVIRRRVQTNEEATHSNLSRLHAPWVSDLKALHAMLLSKIAFFMPFSRDSVSHCPRRSPILIMKASSL